jgi:hypothetical protein
MKKPPKLISPFRRWARRVVWAAFAVVLGMRVLFPPEPTFSNRGGWGGPQPGGIFIGRDGGQRRWRPPARVRTPAGPLPTNIWRMEITMSERDANVLRQTSFEWGRGGRTERPEVQVTVTEGGRVYTNVSLHLKGAAGSFRHFDDKPGMTLNFSKHASGQDFHGLKKLSLNNSVQDPSYVAEAVCRELFLAAGVPVPKTDHATVVVNGRDLGLYVLAEGWGKPFLKKHFKDPGGNLYDSGFVKDVDSDLDINSGDDGPSRPGMRELVEAATGRDRTNRWARLSKVLDVDRFASLLALEVMTCHWDGYGLNRNNYRVFHDRSTGRFVFMPHGMDQMFGRGGRMSPSSSIDPGMQGIVARGFMSTPEGRRLYHDRMKELHAKLFDADRLVARTRELAAEIQPTLAAYGRDFAAEEESAVSELCESIRARSRSIGDQLNRPRQMTTLSGPGPFTPGPWEFRANNQPAREGRSRVGRIERDGLRLLQVDASRQAGPGSWRTLVQLEGGDYRFEGRARISGNGQAGGVCLRISRGEKNYVRGAPDEWVPLSYRFSVEQAADVELVCEFEAGAGLVAFDEGSLRLVRE